MLKKIFALSLLMLLGIYITSCEINGISGSGQVVSVDRKVESFQNIDLSGEGKVILTQGATPGLTIKTDDNFFDYIKSDVIDNTLVIAQQDKDKSVSLKSKAGITYFITVKQLDKISISGAASISSVKPIKGTNLEINSNGASHITLPLDVENLIVNLSGTGDLTLMGTAHNQKVNVSGLGNYEAFDLKSDNVSLSVSGNGYLKVFAEKTLDVNISGSGNVKYIGSPKITLNISGSGTVQKI